MDLIWAMDFLVVPTLTFRMLYVFVIVSHERRGIIHVGVPIRRGRSQARPYPPLCLHADNLVFTCGVCNRRHKSTKNPIRRQGRGALRGTFLPYGRPGAEEIEPEFDISISGAVRFVPSPTASVHAVTRIANLEHLYGFSRIHSDRLRLRYKELVRSVIDVDGVAPSRSHAEEILQRKSRSTLADDYVVSRYAKWISSNALDTFVEDCAKWKDQGDWL